MAKSRDRRRQRSAKRGQNQGGAGGNRKPEPKAKPDTNGDVVDADFEDVDEGEQTTALTRRSSGGALGDLYTPSPLARLSPEAFTERLQVLMLEQQRIEEVKRAILIPDVEGDGSGDYGIIPGTKKPSLYQSGAEKFNRLFQLRPVYRRERVEGDGVKTPNFRFLVECDLVDSQGRVVGTGAGSCSNFEVKYRYRNAGLECPECGATEIRVSKFEDSKGFYCWKKPEAGHDGCGAQFAPNDQRITSQTVGRIANPDPHDCENTVQQMADKRAYVKATRTTHALSNTFTQESGGDGVAGDPPPVADAKAEQKAQRAGRTKITEAQLKAVRERIAGRAAQLADGGVSVKDVEAGVCDLFSVEKLEDLNENVVGDVVKATFDWEPPTS